MNKNEKELLAKYIEKEWPREKVRDLIENAKQDVSAIQWLEKKPTYNHLFHLICQIRGQNPRDAKRKRKRIYALTRQIFIYLAIKMFAPEYYENFPNQRLPQEVGRQIRQTINRDHATVYVNFRTVENLVKLDKEISAEVAHIEAQIVSMYSVN